MLPHRMYRVKIPITFAPDAKQTYIDHRRPVDRRGPARRPPLMVTYVCTSPCSPRHQPPVLEPRDSDRSQREETLTAPPMDQWLPPPPPPAPPPLFPPPPREAAAPQQLRREREGSAVRRESGGLRDASATFSDSCVCPCSGCDGVALCL